LNKHSASAIGTFLRLEVSTGMQLLQRVKFVYLFVLIAQETINRYRNN